MAKYDDFISHVRRAVGRDIYCWGAGQPELKTLSEMTLTFIRNKETSTENANRVIQLWNERKKIFPDAYAADCSGGIIYCMMLAGLVSKSFDTTANGLLGKCKSITKSQLREGDWVGQRSTSGGNIFHIGVVDRIDLDGTIWINEWRGRDAGCVCTKFENGARPWNVFGRPDWVYDASKPISQNPPLPNPISFTLTRKLSLQSPYMKGDDVHAVQNNLIANKLSVGSTGADGVYGGATKDAVRDFQKAKGFTVNGMVDEETCVALGGTWKVASATPSKPVTTPTIAPTVKPTPSPIPTPVAPVVKPTTSTTVKPTTSTTTTVPNFTISRILKYNPAILMQGEDVKNLQKFLISKKYSVGSDGADGKYGRNTRSAVIAYQAANHIFPDGAVGPQTCAVMGIKWTGR